MRVSANSAVCAPAPSLTAIGLAALMVICLAAASQAVGITEEVTARTGAGSYEVVYRINVPGNAVHFRSNMGYDTVLLEGADHLKTAGHPRLPARTVWIAIPSGMKVTDVREARAVETTLPGTYDIGPAQLPIAITGEPLEQPPAIPDPSVYASAAPYPADRVEFLHQADLAGQNLAALRICPLQYRPTTGELVLASELEVVIEGEPGYRCGDYMAPQASGRSRAMYERMLEGMVVNPGDLRMAEESSLLTLRGVAPGQYDYVIVTQQSWVDDFQPLADWRTKQGWKVNIVSTEWIFTGGEYTGTDLEKMRAFIVDAHATWGTTHFVLGADTNIIPFHTRAITVPTWGTDYITNDTYYADYDDDWILEVTVARMTARTVGQIANMTDKIFRYEKNPPLTGYVKTAFFVGMDITVCGDMDGENFKENYIRAMHLPASYALDTEYDAEAGTHRADILSYLDSGYHLVNHHDHCNADCMGAGWTCHSDLFYIADVESLTNADELSVFFAVGCFPADFSVIKCIGESIVRYSGGAGIAFMGNTSYGWGGDAADPDYYALRQDRYFYRNLFDLGIYNLGENFTRLKNDEYDPVDPYNLHQYAFTNLHLLGDPGLTIWTDDPQLMAVSHPASLTAGEATTFDVSVSSGGDPVDGATVCLWKDGDIHDVEETVGGEASFGCTPAEEGTLYVTVCCHNYIPYEGLAEIGPSAGAPGRDPAVPARLEIVSAVPTPFQQSTRISFAIPGSKSSSRVTVAVFDCRGRLVSMLRDDVLEAGVYHHTWNGRDEAGNEVASGVYYCEIRWQSERDTRQLVLLR